MKSIEVAANGGKHTIDLHAALTVLSVAGEQRDEILTALVASLGPVAVVSIADVPEGPPAPAAPPGPSPVPAAASDAGSDVVEAEAAVARAESGVADARRAIEEAERAYTSAQSSLMAANRAIDKDALDAVTGAEARLEVTQAGAAAARRVLAEAREAHEQDLAAEAARSAAARERALSLQTEKHDLDEKRLALVARLGELGAPPDPAPVEEALSGLHRLQQVRPRPSERGGALAERWVVIRARLSELPAPPSPPEWLVTPALAALHDAREALAKAEGSSAPAADPALIEAVEHAHRDVLDAEQRVMRKGNRSNRRRLDAAQELERGALAAVGVGSYGEYLQRLAPDVDGGQSREDRIAQARAALTDAEAVWEELHGGQASPEYTAAKEEEAEVRTAAFALLGEDVDDADVEDRLRAHLETVVETEWALQQLTEALAERGLTVAADADLEALANEWLASVPGQIAARDDIDREIGELDARLVEVDAALAEHKTAVFFGQDEREEVAGRSPEERGAGVPPAEPFADLAAALADAEGAEIEAQDALRIARRRLDESNAAANIAAERETEVDAARAAVEEARRLLAETDAALDAARSGSAEASDAAEAAKAEAERAAAKRAAEAAAAAAAGASSRSGSLASDVWLLARLVSARAASAEAPVVVDARAVRAGRGLRLLERATARGQVLVLGDEGEVQSWAAGLGDRAVIRKI